jgi:hypothetical protein
VPKQDKLGYRRSIDASIACLTRAVSIVSDPEYYLQLALACQHKRHRIEEKAEKTEKEKAELAYLKSRALAYCQHVKELDFQNKFADRIKEIETGLEDKKPEADDSKTAKYEFSSTVKGTLSSKKPPDGAEVAENS